MCQPFGSGFSRRLTLLRPVRADRLDRIGSPTCPWGKRTCNPFTLTRTPQCSSRSLGHILKPRGDVGVTHRDNRPARRCQEKKFSLYLHLLAIFALFDYFSFQIWPESVPEVPRRTSIVFLEENPEIVGAPESYLVRHLKDIEVGT